MVSPQSTNDLSQRTGELRSRTRRIARVAVPILFAACLLITLTAGLWPFSSPINDATLLPNANGIRFSLHGTAVSDGRLGITASGSEACSLEVWLQPAIMWTTGTPLSFYDSRTKQLFLIRQDYIDLALQLAGPDRLGSEGSQSFRVADVFRQREVLLAITSDGRKTSIYADGRLLAESPTFPLSGKDLSGQMILGNAPLRNHNWLGAVKGVAIYSTELSAQQVLEHYRDWAEQREAALATSKDLKALYLFREHSGNVIHDVITPGVDLKIPRKFVTVDQLHFERPKSEAHADGHYRDNIVFNIVGFMPLGFVAALFFAVFYSTRRAVILATLVGAGTSLTIEYFQAYLPTRYSGVTDLITNPLGACIGAIIYCAAAKFALKKIWG